MRDADELYVTLKVLQVVTELAPILCFILKPIFCLESSCHTFLVTNKILK